MPNLTLAEPVRSRPEPMASRGTTPRSQQDLTLWMQAMKLSGLGGLLRNPGGLTLLGLDGSGLQDSLSALGMDLPRARTRPEGLRTLLLNHVLQDPLDLRTLVPGQRVQTLGGLSLRWPGQHPTLAPVDGRALTLSACGGSAATATWRHVGAAQEGLPRVLLVLDRPLQAPRHTLLQALAALPECSAFTKAVRLSGWDVVLGSEGPFTVFAPVNGDLTLDAAHNDVEALREWVGRHIVPGAWPTDQLPWGQVLRTISGQTLSLSALGQLGLKGNAHTLSSQQDLASRNGWLHVMSPPPLLH